MGNCFYCTLYFPSVLLPVSETGWWVCSILYIWNGCQRERKKEWMQNGERLSTTTCQIEIEAIPFVPVSWASLIDICWWEFVLDDVLHFTSQGLSQFSLPSPFKLLSQCWDHKLLNIKPCFQSVRHAIQCQGPSHPLLHLWRHLGGKICVPLHTLVICTCIIQEATHTPHLKPRPPTRPRRSVPIYCKGTVSSKTIDLQMASSKDNIYLSWQFILK